MGDWRAADGRSVIIALDHGLLGVPVGLENIRARVTEIVAAGPDALIVTPGLAKAVSQWELPQQPALFITCDYRASATWPEGKPLGEAYRAIATPADARRLGAIGVKVMMMFGRENLATHADNVAFVARCARECEQVGLTMMIEPVLWGTQVPAERQHEAALVRHAVRLAVELGADVIKSPYTGDASSIGEICQHTPIPIVTLGGPKRATEDEVILEVVAAVGSGAAGVALGRNVFQSNHHAAFIHRLRQAVHG